MKRRVFIIDEHPICRHGLTQLLNGEPDLVVCGEAENTTQAFAALRSVNADMIMIDVSPQTLAGPDGVKLLRKAHPDLPTLALSNHDDSLYALRTLRAGANGYLMKREGLNQVVEAVRRVLAGKMYLNPAFGEQIIAKLAHSEEAPPQTTVDKLSERELEVLRLLGSGQSTKQIAATLQVSHKTVESHRLHIKEKLGVGTAAELVRFATAWVEQQDDA